MSEQTTDSSNNADEKALPSVTVDKKERPDGLARLAVTTGNLLEQADAIVYAIVGICFILGALLALGYTFWSFSNSINDIPKSEPSRVQTSSSIVCQHHYQSGFRFATGTNYNGSIKHGYPISQGPRYFAHPFFGNWYHIGHTRRTLDWSAAFGGQCESGRV